LTVVVVASAPVAQDVRDPGPGEWLAELLASLNSGDFNRISEFSGEAGWNPAYLWSLHQEFGPLAFGLRAGNAYWCHGELTKAWVGLVVEGRGSRYRLAGVRRGIYPAGRPVADPVAANEFADYLQGYLESNSTRNHFSGAVLVAKNGEVLFRGAYGLANRGLGVRNTVDTRFQLASITKMFIGVAISQLVERGELSFSDPIRKFIPEYPQHIAEQVTVHHLLTHTSGIEIDDYPPYNQAVRQAESIEELLAAQVRYIEHLNLGNYDDFEPLDRFDYTNEGVDLLGVIIERVSGLGWEEYLHEHVFSPAGMRDTGLTSGDTHVENLAVGYSLRTADLRGRVAGPRREVRPGTALGNAARPAGSGYSTIADMMRFVGALRNEELLTAEYWATMTKPHIESPLRIPGFERSYGYTIDIKVIDGVRAIGHSGGAPGMSTMLDIYPEHGYLVLVLSNFDNSSARNVSLHIREVLGIPANER
jgi:CubicO group peptidase (beta-lactamase class C family)